MSAFPLLALGLHLAGPRQAQSMVFQLLEVHKDISPDVSGRHC